MTRAPSPLLGYNNNVRHKNRVFHIQTEDSGVKRPHIITHLFMDGGRILKSVKTSYAEFIGVDGMADTVRAMMKDQHKAMFIALRDGQYDDLVESGDPKAAAAAKKKADDSKAALAAADSTESLPASDEQPAAAAAPASAPIAAAPVAAAASPAPAAVASGSSPTSKKSVPPSTAATSPKSEDAAPATTRTSPELTLDIDALERAAKDAETSSPLFQRNSDLPPPPQNLFRDKPATGTYRTTTTTNEAQPRTKTPKPPGSKRSSRPPPAPRASPSAARVSSPTNTAVRGANAGRPSSANNPRVIVGPTNENRYAPARPAAIFGQSRPQHSGSIFGEDLISDKSLDEVILSYLAEDLEGDANAKKK